MAIRRARAPSLAEVGAHERNRRDLPSPDAGARASRRRYDEKPREPNYYREIGRLGGEASVATRKRRIYAEVKRGVCEPEPVPTSAPPLQPPSPTPQIKRRLTLADILGEEYLINLA